MAWCIEIAYIAYWLWTFDDSGRNRGLYLQRLAVTAATLAWLTLFTVDREKQFIGLLTDWLIAAEVICFVNALWTDHYRVFPRS